MKSPLSQSFLPAHSSLRSVGVDRFRLMLKGWSLKLLSLLLVVMVGGMSWGQTTYTLITSTSNLVAGGKYIITNSGSAGNGVSVLGYQNTNNRPASTTTVTVSAGLAISLTPASSGGILNAAYQLTLGGSAGAWTFTDAATTITLQATSSSSNYLKSGPGTWTITFGTGAVITCNNGGANNLMRFNTNLFSSYGSGQSPIYLYAANNTVTYNANGGSITTSSQTAAPGSSLTTATSLGLTRSNYIFSGWNTLANGTGTSYADAAAYPFIAAGTLYAQWTAITAPNAPTITSITPSNGQLSVAFTAGSNGGSSITNYKYSTDGGANFSSVSPSQTTSPIVITGLTNGTSYNVQIKAVNVMGDGTATASIAATPATTPNEPTISSIIPSNGQLSVAFTPPSSNGSSAITTYQYSTNGGINWQTRASGTTSSPLDITTLSTNGSTVLTNGTSYTIQIRAVNAIGYGIASTSNSATPATTPSAPTINSITPSNGQISVLFTAGATGGSAITNYKYSTDNGYSFSPCSPEQTSSPIVITGLTNGTSYNVQIKAVNAIGDGTATSSTIATLATTPSAPSITSITPGNQELSVAFISGATGGSVITNYKYSTDGGNTFTELSPVTTTSPITITGLTNDTQYNVQIKAVNAQGDGAASASSLGTPTAAAVAPGAPTISSITPSNQQLSVAFTAGATGGSTITNYKYSIDGGTSFSACSPEQTSSPIVITGLTNGTSYNVQIKAVNAIGDGAATASTVATPVTTPSAPSITLITPSNGQLSVAFTSGATGGSAITNYKYSTDGGSTFTPVSPAATTSPISITGLSNGTSYDVQIKAVNAIGDGIATASTAATPITTPGAPTIGTATAGNGQATITFTAPASNGGSAITSYTATSTPGSITGTLNQAGSGTITVTGLTNGTAYTFTIKANNAAGASTASAASNSVTPVLSAPVANAATNVSCSNFTANWTAETGASSGYLLDVSTKVNFCNNATDLFISEYVEGSSNNKYIEIFNGTGSDVNLTNYKLQMFTNGASTASTSVTLSGTLANGNTMVYKNTSATAYSNTATINTAVNFNGNDAVALYKISTASYVDIFGVIGTDPGSAWTASGSYSTLDKTLVRKSTVYSGVTTNPTSFSTLSSEWDLYNIDDVGNLGSHTFYAPSFVSGYEAKIISGQATTNDVVNGLNSGTTYYYRVRANSGSSISGNSSTIAVTTSTPPSTPTGTGAARCDDGTVTISATPGAGATIDWYSASTGGTLLASGSTSYVTPIISITTVYYAEARNTSGGCTSVSRQAVTATVNITPSAPTASATQTFCSGATISNLSATGSPIQWYAAATSGSPLSIGSSLVNNTHYYVSRTINGCESSRTDVTATVNANNIASVASSTPTLCINTALTAITHSTTGATGIGTATGLPAGVSAAWLNGTITISGTPTASGTINYSIPLIGGCGSINAIGTITVTPSNTVGTASSTPTLCISTLLTAITHTTTGATGIGSPSGLPSGVSASWASNSITISGTPSASGTFNYSIPLTGGCGSVNATGTITVTPSNTVGIASSSPTLCISTLLTAITHSTTGATGIGSTSGLPLGVTAAWISNTITISGTPTQSGTFNYSIPLTGGCGSVNATGTITVIPANTVETSSSTPTLFVNTPLTSITHTTSGANNIGTATGLPAGVSASWANDLITISGTPTALGTFTYSIPLTGGCGSVNATGTITVVNAYTWTGAVSSAWSTSGNWSPNGVPTSANNVNIPASSTNELEVLSSLTIDANATFTLKSNAKLTLNGIIDNNGTFTIESGATLVQTGSGNNSGNGTYNVKQNITGAGSGTPSGRFWYLGSPLSDASSTALLSSTGNQLWQWNESNFSYAPVTSGNLTQGKSYVLRSGQTTETINFSGTGLSNGTVTVPNLTRTGTAHQFRGCHLVSNPYPSYLDWELIDKTNLSPTMYIRTASANSIDVLETYNADDHFGTSISGPALTKFIAPMQGFWVKVAADTQTGSMTMTNAMRSHQPTGSGLRSTPQDFPAFLRFNMLDGQNKDQIILFMTPNATSGIDSHDSEKMSASGYAQFYSTVNAKKLVINGMKNVKAKTSVPLTLEMPSSKSYTFQAEEFNIEDGLILLEDKQEGVIQDLTINPTYSFFGNAGTNATRFVVHFQLANAPILVGGPMELESLGSDELTSENIQIVSNNQGTIIIRMDEGFKPEGSVRIFDASGRLVEQSDFNDQETTIQLNEQAGMYFVEVNTGKLMVKKKIVIE